MHEAEMQNDEMQKRLVRETGPALTVAKLADPVLEDLGLRLVRVRVSGTGNSELQIMAERLDGTLTIEDCVSITRALSPVLDVEDPISGQYRLEVSSPGIDRPLTRLKDFEMFDGYQVKLLTHELIEGRKRFSGALRGVEDGEVLIEIPEGIIGLQFDWLAEAKLVLTDELIAESLKARKDAGILTEDFDEVDTSETEED